MILFLLIIYIIVFLKAIFKGLFYFLQIKQNKTLFLTNIKKITLLYDCILFESIHLNQAKINSFAFLFYFLLLILSLIILPNLVSTNIAYCMEANNDIDMLEEEDEEEHNVYLLDTILNEIEDNLYIFRINGYPDRPFFFNYHAGAPYTSIPYQSMPQVLENLTNEMNEMLMTVSNTFNFIKPSEIDLDHPGLTSGEYLEIFDLFKMNLTTVIQIQNLAFTKIIPLYYNYLFYYEYNLDFFNNFFFNSMNNFNTGINMENTRILPPEIRGNIIDFIIHPYMENFIDRTQQSHNFLINSVQIINENILYLNSLQDNDAVILVEEEEDNSLNFIPTNEIKYNNLSIYDIKGQFNYYRNNLIESNYQQNDIYNSNNSDIQRLNQMNSDSFSIVRR